MHDNQYISFAHIQISKNEVTFNKGLLLDIRGSNDKLEIGERPWLLEVIPFTVEMQHWHRAEKLTDNGLLDMVKSIYGAQYPITDLKLQHVCHGYAKWTILIEHHKQQVVAGSLILDRQYKRVNST